MVCENHSCNISAGNISAEEVVVSDRLVASTVERYIEATILTSICLLSLVGNISLVIIINKDRSLRTRSNWLVLCLTAADLFVSCVNMPVTVVTLTLGDWFLSDRACTIFGFITMVTFIASVMSLGMISLNRFIFICHNAHFRSVYTAGYTVLIIIGTWLLAILLALPPLLGWGRYDFLPGQSFCFCDWKTSISYTFFMVGTCFGGPCSVMTFCYVKILQEVRQSQQRIASLQKENEKPTMAASTAGLGAKTSGTLPGATAGTVAADVGHAVAPPVNDAVLLFVVDDSGGVDDGSREVSCGGVTHAALVPTICVTSESRNSSALFRQNDSATLSLAQRRQLHKHNMAPVVEQKKQEKRDRKRKEELRLTLSFLVVICVFILCWLPFCVTMFMSVFMTSPVPRVADMATLLLGCANSCCNPIIYGVMNTKFREGYRRLYCSLCRKRSLKVKTQAGRGGGASTVLKDSVVS